MPPERSTATSNNNGHTGTGNGNGNSNANRPQMPSLSASAARAANKTPLMPKLATKAQPPTLATTPITRRPQRPPTASANGQHAQQHDELLASSMPPFLANITPRTGSRQNRVDSANTTPNGTPHPERHEWSDQRFGSGPASPPSRPDYNRRSTSSFSALQHESNGQGGREHQHASESKFFHASDVHNTRPQATPKQNPAKQSTFFYASNRNSIENRPNNASAPSQAMPTATQSQHDISSKFMYANGTPEMQSSSLSVPLTQAPRPAATSAPKPSTGRLSVGSQASLVHNQRPTSPTKGPSQPTQPSLMSSAIPPTMSTQRGPPSHLPGSAADKLRRTSSGTSRARGPHSRSGSLVLTDLGTSASVPPSKLMSPQYPSSPVHTPSTPTPLTLASIIQAAEDLPDHDESHSADESRSEVQSPTKSNSNSADPANELVANARRERKVQDLQITNASLEAINRTLERQLRKQTTELRRFKRMSRAGLSLASTAASSSIPSEAIFVEEVGLRLANLSEDESDAEAEDEAEEESFSDTDEDVESLTPNQLAERDAKHQERDQQRLKLDLTKHQQLLVDSQQINQSIKRCLDWTEELIKDGKKALAYNVKISDVELISRLPNALPNALGIIEEKGGSSHLGDDLAVGTLKAGNLITEDPEGISDWRVGPQDRDSGIEMPVDGG
ncbi:hypothetical protein SLS62_000918 [Diatrype stigma]|uniref:Uncharacterized protein n=1 Tax=Diatrype stigma TaxID=117547 RepID=A0AAN9YW71_9PEZI